MAPLQGVATSHLQSVISPFSSFGGQLKRSIAAELPKSKAVIDRAVTLLRRGSDPGSGVTPPNNIPNNAVFGLFGLIGAGFVLTGIWFFFWAKNGGFHFRQGDWDEYKSTVLRRTTGPNGTTLSGGTRSTDLGGGSVVGKRQRKARYRDVDAMTSIGTESEMSQVMTEKVEKKSHKKGKKSRKNRSVREGVFGESVVSDSVVSSSAVSSSVVSGSVVGDSAVGDSVVSGDLQDEHLDEAIRAYRHEKPARVGGINGAPEGSSFEGSNIDSQSGLLSNRQHTPTSTPKKKSRKSHYAGGSASPGIRKVESTSDKSGSSSRRGSRAATETQKSVSDIDDHIKAEARRLQEKGRAAMGRRDVSYSIGDDASMTTASRDDRRSRRSSRPSESRAQSEAGSSESTGTKTYPHPMPELSIYVEEKRRARASGGGGGGYRRDRRDRDEFSDLD